MYVYTPLNCSNPRQKNMRCINVYWHLPGVKYEMLYLCFVYLFFRIKGIYPSDLGEMIF